MKINKYIYLSALSIVAVMPSCSSDYLNVEPVTNVSREQSVATVDAAQLTLDGIVSSMNKQYSSLDFNGNCGEAYVNSVCNDYFGPDLTSGLWSYYITQYNWQNFDQDRAYVNIIPWMYEYNLINQANIILDGIDNAEGDTGQRDFIKASALTFRAHAYQKLLGWYGQRWEDSRNGEAYCVVLRTVPGTEPSPLVTMNTVFNQIYADLDLALELFESCGVDRSRKYDVNASVAAGVYARAALMKHDWAKAQAMAAKARSGYTIMDKTTVLAGFTDDCSDYIWHMNPSFDTTYYWSWGSHYTCNGGYVPAWAFGAGGISIDLYNLTDEKDVRREMYLTPDKVSRLLPIVENVGSIKPKDFWNPTMVDELNFLNLAKTGPYTKAQAAKNPGMYNVALLWSYKYKYEIFTGDLSRFNPDDYFWDYYYEYPSSPGETPNVKLKNGTYGVLVNIPFGAQYKFWGEIPYGNMCYPWMRASEMALVEAEAYCEMGEDAKARACLAEVNSKRIDKYSTNKTGDELMQEIRVTRRIELWGEGHNFTDFKRWNLPMIRREWVANDPESGNFAPGFGLYKEPSANHGWRFHIPYNETAYNTAVDLSLLNE